MAHGPDEQTVEEANASPGTSDQDALTAAIAEAIRRQDEAGGTDDLLGGVPDGFATGGVPLSGIRGGEVPAFQQGASIGSTPATFRESSLVEMASWPIEKRSRLILQMQKAGLVSADTAPRFWGPDVTGALTEALSFANLNGITDPFEAVGVYGQQKAAAEQKAKPKFNFVSRDFLPPDPATLDEDIRGLAKKMFAGTDIDLSDEEVASLRGQFEGLLHEQHFNAEQQRLGEEKTDFDAQVASSEGQSFDGSVPAVPQVDAAARFRNVFEERYQPELDAVDKLAEDDEQRDLASNTLGRVLQFATGRQ